MPIHKKLFALKENFLLETEKTLKRDKQLNQKMKRETFRTRSKTKCEQKRQKNEHPKTVMFGGAHSKSEARMKAIFREEHRSGYA